MDQKHSDAFLRGFACGWCAFSDLMRNKGMEDLPNPTGQRMVAFANAAEAYFHSSGLGKLLGPYQTQEMRDAVLKEILATGKRA
jgi:hypothetical protein